MAERIDTIYAKKLATAQALTANFDSDTHWIKASSRLGIWIDAASVTDNTGEFVIKIRANTSNTAGSSDESNWHTLGISTPLVLNNASTVLYTQVELPPCELIVSYTVGGVTPNGTATIWLSSGSIGGI